MKNHNYRILIVCNMSLPRSGAPWRRIEYFANFFTTRGMLVDVVGALQPERNMKNVFRNAKGIMYDKFRVFNFQWQINILNLMIEIFNLLGTFPIFLISLILRPNVIVVSIPHIEPLPIAYITAKFLKIKLIVDVRDPLDYWPSWTKGFTRKLFSFINIINYSVMRKADLVLAVTPSLVSLLAKQGVRARLVMNGADVYTFRPHPRSEARRKLGLSDDAAILVFNGYLGGYYDATPLLQAIAKLPNELKNKMVYLLVGGFGDATYARKFVRVANELRLSGNIKVLRPIQDARKLAEVLSAADVGVITRVTSELYDPTIPAKFYEYVACGLPVIALIRRGSELWRLIEKWEVGFACEPHDLDCVTRALEKIFDESIMESIRANVLRVRPLIDRRQAAEKLFSLLRELLEPKRDA
jgi:glycosyltransferase involved in cell wall biosynthesis